MTGLLQPGGFPREAAWATHEQRKQAVYGIVKGSGAKERGGVEGSRSTGGCGSVYVCVSCVGAGVGAVWVWVWVLNAWNRDRHMSARQGKRAYSGLFKLWLTVNCVRQCVCV